MRYEVGSGFDRHQHVAVLVTGISAAAIATSSSAVVMQLEHASRNRVASSLRHGESSLRDQGANSLDRDPYQFVSVDRITHRSVIGLVLAKHGSEQHQFPAK
jgi:hypothetical protein